MKQIPKFINSVQRVHAGAVRFGDLSADGEGDGLYPVDSFHLGKASMAEDDWRIFELTPENADAMVKQANEDIAAGKKLHVNYAHDRNGPHAGEIVRVERAPGGGVQKIVRWTERARAAIRAKEWDGTSPEFYAKVVRDENGKPKEIEGRVLMQPFALVGGALDNDPAMPDLAIAANKENAAMNMPKCPDCGATLGQGSDCKICNGAKMAMNNMNKGAGVETRATKEEEMDIKKLAVKLGLPETATEEDVEKALDEKMKPAPVAEPVAAAASKQTMEAVAAMVLAKIDPAKLALQIHESAKKVAIDAIRAEDHEKACGAAVDGAIRAGRVKKSERDQALKLAKADLESFRTMTASMKVVAPVSGVYVPGDASTQTAIPSAPHVKDHVGAALDEFSQENASLHQSAMAYIEKAEKSGTIVTYRDAVTAIAKK